MNRTTGRITSAKSRKPSPKSEAGATSASATIAPDNDDRNIPARLNDSFHARLRDASRLQCSVLSTWSWIASGVPPSVGSDGPGVGAGSAPGPVPAVERSMDIG